MTALAVDPTSRTRKQEKAPMTERSGGGRLVVDALKKDYELDGAAVPVVKDVTFTIEPGTFLLPPRAVGVRQDDDAALRRRARAEQRRRHLARRQRALDRHRARVARQARHRHGVPELRDLAAHDGLRQCDLPAAGRGFQAAEAGGAQTGDGGTRAGAARPSRTASGHRAVGRSAAATRARSRPRSSPAAAAARRAAVEPRRQAARHHAQRAAEPAAHPRHQCPLRDA